MIAGVDLDYQKSQCEINMNSIDGLAPPMRDLVHEFGFAIVAAMINDGYYDAVELRGILKTRLDRRQNEWLATDYITPAVAEIIKGAFLAPRRPGRRIRARRGLHRG
jgi:hypothetical protein